MQKRKSSTVCIAVPMRPNKSAGCRNVMMPPPAALSVSTIKCLGRGCKSSTSAADGGHTTVRCGKRSLGSEEDSKGAATLDESVAVAVGFPNMMDWDLTFVFELCAVQYQKQEGQEGPQLQYWCCCCSFVREDQDCGGSNHRVKRSLLTFTKSRSWRAHSLRAHGSMFLNPKVESQ